MNKEEALRKMFDELGEKFGFCEAKAGTFAFLEYPEAENYGTPTRVCYFAHAINSSGKKFLLRFDYSDEFVSADDEQKEQMVTDGSQCDWDSPVEIKSIVE